MLFPIAQRWKSNGVVEMQKALYLHSPSSIPVPSTQLPCYPCFSFGIRPTPSISRFLTECASLQKRGPEMA